MRTTGASDGSVYHYTRADTFLRYIAPFHRLRLSPFAQSIDPKENLPPLLSLTDMPQTEDLFPGYQEFFNRLTTRSFMICFANSYDELKPGFFTPESSKGWASAAMWAHFADQHSGVCLEFDKNLLVSDFMKAAQGSSIALHGDILYISPQEVLETPPILMTGMANLPQSLYLNHVLNNPIPHYFTKDSAWAYEQEFRLIAVNDCQEPVFVPISNSLRRIIIGSKFPEDQVPLLLWILDTAGFRAHVERMTWGDWAAVDSVGPSESRDTPPFGARPPHPNGHDGEHIHSQDCMPSFGPTPSPKGARSRARRKIISHHINRIDREIHHLCQLESLDFHSTRRRPNGLSELLEMNVLDSLNQTLCSFKLELPLETSLEDGLSLRAEIVTSSNPTQERSWQIGEDEPEQRLSKIMDALDWLIHENLVTVCRTQPS